MSTVSCTVTDILLSVSFKTFITQLSSNILILTFSNIQGLFLDSSRKVPRTTDILYPCGALRSTDGKSNLAIPVV